MTKELCLIHANCQRIPLHRLLLLHPQFSEQYEIRVYVNYTREHVPEEDLKRCSIFLYQWLEEENWGEISSPRLLAKVPKSCRCICIPNIFFNAYWPLWGSTKTIIFGDLLLDELFDRGLSLKEILHVYLHGDIKKFHNLDELHEKALEYEFEKEKRWAVPITQYIVNNFKDRRLLYSVNHPGKDICIRVGNTLLKLMGYPPLGKQELLGYDQPFANFHLPIHPVAAEHFGLRFTPNAQRIKAFGAYITLEEYVIAYVNCREKGIWDLSKYLEAYGAMQRLQASQTKS